MWSETMRWAISERPISRCEEHHRAAQVGGHVHRGAEGEGGLADGGARGDHGQLGGLEAEQPVVEVDIAGRHAQQPTRVLDEGLEVAHELGEHDARIGEGAGTHPLLGEVEHMELGGVESGIDVVRQAVADLDELTPHAHQPAQEDVLDDDVGKGRGIGRARRARLERHQHRWATDGIAGRGTGAPNEAGDDVGGHGEQVRQLS